jgi:hypothetical protein
MDRPAEILKAEFVRGLGGGLTAIVIGTRSVLAFSRQALARAANSAALVLQPVAGG